MKHSLLFAFLLVVLLAVVAPCGAKPMMSATPQEGVQRAGWIVVATFDGFVPPTQKNEDIYWSGVQTRYRIDEQLYKKGKLPALPHGRFIFVTHAFHDGTPCMIDEKFHFDAKLMPAKGSKWLLVLLPEKNGEAYSTYRGDYGRLQDTADNRSKWSAAIPKASK